MPSPAMAPMDSSNVPCCFASVPALRPVFKLLVGCGVRARNAAEALNIANSATWDVDTDSMAPLTACEPLSPGYNVEAKRVTLLRRPKILQAQHCIRGVGAADVMSQCFF